MKVPALLLCAFAVSSYATTFGLTQNEETLFFDTQVAEAEAQPAAEATEVTTTEEVTVPVDTIVVANEEAVFSAPVETVEPSVEVVQETFPVEAEPVDTIVVANEEAVFGAPVETAEPYVVETAPVEQPAVVSEEEVFPVDTIQVVDETVPVETAPVEQAAVVSEEEVFPFETEPVYEQPPVEQTTVVTEEEFFPVETEPIVIAPAPVYVEEFFPEPEPIVIAPVYVYEEEIFQDFEEIPTLEEEVFPTIGGGPVAGGWTDVDLTTVVGNSQIQAILDLGVETLLDTTKDEGNLPETETPFRIKQINQIQTQVVAGTNYYCDVDLTNDAGIKINAAFTVFSQPWTNTLRVTDGCVTIKKLVKY